MLSPVLPKRQLFEVRADSMDPLGTTNIGSAPRNTVSRRTPRAPNFHLRAAAPWRAPLDRHPEERPLHHLFLFIRCWGALVQRGSLLRYVLRTRGRLAAAACRAVWVSQAAPLLRAGCRHAVVPQPWSTHTHNALGNAPSRGRAACPAQVSGARRRLGRAHERAAPMRRAIGAKTLYVSISNAAVDAQISCGVPEREGKAMSAGHGVTHQSCHMRRARQ